MKPIHRNTLAALLTAMLAFSGASALAADATTPVKSMRGIDTASEDVAPEVLNPVGKRPGSQAPITRTFSTQPPVIPHATNNFDDINLEENQCMSCHSPEKYKEKKAVKIGDSHFYDRDGNKLTEVSSRRHNCLQCHVPQVDAPPLVENTFQGDKQVTSSAGAAATPAGKKTTKK